MKEKKNHLKEKQKLKRQISVLKAEKAKLAKELSKLKNTEATLKETESKLTGIYHSMNEGMALHQIIYNTKGKAIDYQIMDINPLYEKITGIKRAKIIGKKATEVYEVKEPPYLDIYSRVAATGKPISFETFFPPMNKYFTISVFSPQKGQFATIFQDITERKLAETKIMHLASFPEHNPNPILEIDAAGKVLFINHGALKILEEKGVPKKVNQFFPKDFNQMLDALKSGKTQTYIREIKIKDSYLLETISILSAFGVIRIYAINITGHKQAELMVKENEEKYRLIIETANEGIVLGDSKGKMNFVNKKMADMLGYPVKDIIGKSGLDFMPEDKKEKVLSNRKRLENKEQFQDEFCFLRKDGTRLWTLGSTTAIFNEQGLHISNLSMHTDITNRKKIEKALLDSEEQFRTIAETLPVSLSITCIEDSTIMYTNPVWDQAFGFKQEKKLLDTKRLTFTMMKLNV